MQVKLLLVTALAGLVSAQAATTGTEAATAPAPTGDASNPNAFLMGSQGKIPPATAGSTYPASWNAQDKGKVVLQWKYAPNGDVNNLQNFGDAITLEGNPGKADVPVPAKSPPGLVLSITEGDNTNYSQEITIQGGSAANIPKGSASGSAAATGTESPAASGSNTGSAEPSATESGAVPTGFETVTGSAQPTESGSAATNTGESQPTETEASKTASSSAASSSAAAVANVKFSSAALFGGLFAAFLAL